MQANRNTQTEMNGERDMSGQRNWKKFLLQKCEKYWIFAFQSLQLAMPEESHNGIAAVLKTAGLPPVGVRVPLPPQP